jgi:perosamine synthetase
MRAALGRSQLGRLEQLLTKRQHVAELYNERLAGVEGVSVPYVADTTSRMSWFVYVIRLAKDLDRNQIMARLQDQGIACRPYFTPIHLQPFYVERYGYKEGDMPVTESVARSTLALPFHSNLDPAAIDLVCDRLQQALHTAKSRP